MRVLILGGGGAMARVILMDLLNSQGVDSVGLADLSLERVKGVAAQLRDDRILPICVDARDEISLPLALKGWDVVVNSTWYELNPKVMGSAIRAGIHYLDLGGLYHVTLRQLEMSPAAVDAGVTCVLGLGSSPGVTNLMAAHGAQTMSKLDQVRIRVGGGAGKSSSSFSPPYSFRTIVDEACLPAAVLKGGRIQMVPGLSVKEEFVLPEPVGKVEGYYTLHSELATLPNNLGKGIREMNFIVAFSPEFSRSLHLLVTLGLTSKEEIQLSKGTVIPYELLLKLVDTLPIPQDQAAGVGIRRVEIFGEGDGKPSHLTYDCISGPHLKWGIGGRALGTGVPASLGAQWLAGGKVSERGVLPPELCVEPGTFLHELSENGRGVVTTFSDGSALHRI